MTEAIFRHGADAKASREALVKFVQAIWISLSPEWAVAKTYVLRYGINPQLEQYP